MARVLEPRVPDYDGGMLRELRQHDADAVVALYRVAFGDERPIDAAEIVSWVQNQELKPEWLQVLEEDGRIVGYGDIGSRMTNWRWRWPLPAAG